MVVYDKCFFIVLWALNSDQSKKKVSQPTIMKLFTKESELDILAAGCFIKATNIWDLTFQHFKRYQLQWKVHVYIKRAFYKFLLLNRDKVDRI